MDALLSDIEVKPAAFQKEEFSDSIALSLSKGDRIMQNLSRFDSPIIALSAGLSANGVFLFGEPQVSEKSLHQRRDGPGHVERAG
jgi:hypothetical protein